MKDERALVTLTGSAASYLRGVLEAESGDTPPQTGIHIALKSKGCAGYGYDLQLVKGKPEKSIECEHNGITLYIDPFASIFLTGTVIDYTDSKLQTGLVFLNPNVKAACGCGESVYFE